MKLGLLGVVCVCALTFGLATQAKAVAVSGQGTWDTTLEARDLGGNPATAEAYYDTVLGITWLARANLAATTNFGVAGIDADGRMRWDVANKWIASMNVHRYLGVSTWRLPTIEPVDGIAFNNRFAFDGSTDNGYSITAPGSAFPNSIASEMSHLYYNALGNNPGTDMLGNQSACFRDVPNYCLTNTGPFININPAIYWYGTEEWSGLDFYFDRGYQGWEDPISFLTFFAWPVADGDIGTPIPPTNISVNTNIPDISLGDVKCSLIEAINEAQMPGSSEGDCITGTTGPDTIELNAEGPYSITSVDNDTDGPNGLPSITTAITINGHNEIIERALPPWNETPLLRIFHVASTGQLRLNQLTVQNGLTGDWGTVSGGYSGGGIYNKGDLTLSGCTLSHNVTSDVTGGGAIYNTESATADISGSVVERNAHDAIVNNGVMTIMRSTVRFNGGESCGSICNGNEMKISDSLIHGNNPEVGASGIYSSGSLVVTNTTITGNASATGPAVLVEVHSEGFSAEIINSTIAENTSLVPPDPYFQQIRGPVTLRNTTVYFSDLTFPLCRGNVMSMGHNIANDDSCNLTAPGDQPNTDPMLGELADNGGPTLTRALLAGSPAIDAGEVNCADADGSLLLTDQRGFPRPVDGNGDGETACDVGAFEVQPVPVVAIDIEKLTNGIQADAANDSDVPRLAPGSSVTWTYEVTNSGEVAFPLADVVVTDSEAGLIPVLDVTSDDGDSLLSPGEMWSYTATGQALDLRNPAEVVTLVPGCDDGRPTYENTGSVTAPGASDSDLSHYCNPDTVDTTIVAAVLPASRSVQVGNPATAFGTIINSGAADATRCGISPVTTVPAICTYQTTDPNTNALIVTPNTPADIAAGESQSYVFAFTPTAEILPTDVQLSFDCTNTFPAPVTVGLNTLSLSASTNPVSDIVALAATPSGDGIVSLPGNTGDNAFAVATVNVGSQDSITASADTGDATLPVTLSICESIPATGACLSPPAASVTTAINAGATPTFSIFVTGTGTVPFDPAGNRIFVRFRDAGGVIRGSTSVAVRTQ